MYHETWDNKLPKKKIVYFFVKSKIKWWEEENDKIYADLAESKYSILWLETRE